MGSVCSNCETSMEYLTGTEREKITTMVESRPILENLSITDFEQRVKMHAHPANEGKISFRQL